MTKRKQQPDLPAIHINDVLDYAYCGMLVWWRKYAPDAEREETLSADDLLRVAVQETIRIMYSRPGRPPAEILGRIWGTWLKKWGIPEIHKDLSEFASKYRILLSDFSEKGNFRRRDGSLYIKPTWSSAWKEQFSARGLHVLKERISGMQHLSGLPRTDSNPSQEGRFSAPLGLAEAYALSLTVVSQFDTLPAGVLGSRIKLITDLPTIRIISIADLVTPLGTSRRPGRPSASTPQESQVVQYELHLFDETVPTPSQLMRDYRVLALFHARPPDLPSESIRTQSVLVRLMRSGKYQVIPARGEGGLLGLETAARFAYHGIRSGIFVPRSILGEDTCVDCALRPRCLVGEGVLERLTIDAPENAVESQEFAHYLHRQFDGLNKQRVSHANVTAEVLRWLSAHPSVSLEQAQWIIGSYIAS